MPGKRAASQGEFPRDGRRRPAVSSHTTTSRNMSSLPVALAIVCGDDNGEGAGLAVKNLLRRQRWSRSVRGSGRQDSRAPPHHHRRLRPALAIALGSKCVCVLLRWTRAPPTPNGRHLWVVTPKTRRRSRCARARSSETVTGGTTPVTPPTKWTMQCSAAHSARFCLFGGGGSRQHCIACGGRSGGTGP
jgi:hypothetical protein